MKILSSEIAFPSIEEAQADGLLAIGGDLSMERLLLAYRSGIFPWFDDGQPILWWSPDPRMVLFPEDLKISKSFRKTIRSQKFRVTFNQSFREVIEACSTIKREGQHGTWITQEMLDAYYQLHEKGYAISVEVWLDGQLAGGLYGVDISEGKTDKKVFCGESMFSKVSDASKVGLYHLIEKLKTENYKLIDCQMYTPHLESLGAKEIPRSNFLTYLK